METAKDILAKHRQTGAVNVPFEDALAAMKEIAEICFECGVQRGIDEEVEDTCGFIQDCPDKEETMKELFPESIKDPSAVGS